MNINFIAIKQRKNLKNSKIILTDDNARKNEICFIVYILAADIIDLEMSKQTNRQIKLANRAKWCHLLA